MAKMEFRNGKEMAEFARGLSAAPNQPREQLNTESEEPSAEAERFTNRAEILRGDFRYYPDTQIYQLYGEKYQEGQMIAYAVDEGVYLLNFDPVSSNWYNKHISTLEQSALVPWQVGHFTAGELARNSTYRKFYNFAKRKNYPCFVVLCQGGQLHTPCYSFTDEQFGRQECLVCLFNAMPCEWWHRQMLCAVEIQVGNLGERLFISYHRGATIDWQQFVQTKVKQLSQEDTDFALYTESPSYIDCPSHITVKKRTKRSL